MYAVRARHAFDGERFLDGGATVLVDGGRIAGVESHGYPVPAGCPVRSYDGTLVPGLVETHVHLVADSSPMALDRVAGYSGAEIDAVVTEALGRHLAAGVTTVRDLGDRDFNVVARRDAQDGSAEPRIVAAGPPITTVGGHCHFLGGEVSGLDQIRAAVQERVVSGVDVVKVMASGGMATAGTDPAAAQFSLEELRLVVEEAHAAGLPVAAHAHAASAARLALEVGVDSIEHASYIVPRAELPPDVPAAGHLSEDDLVRLVESRVSVCPTMGGFNVGMLRDAPPRALARLREFGFNPETMVSERRAMIRRMAEAGVRLVSGADAGIAPGKAHGRYAEALIELGAVTPIEQTLASATSLAAEVCRLGDRTGRLRAGYDADLAVFDGDLRDDLAGLRRVAAVVLRGQPLT
jgi:imidazolonepropionase-like amidohydrolase